MDDGKPIVLERKVIGVAGGFVVPGYRLGRRRSGSLRFSVANVRRASDGCGQADVSPGLIFATSTRLCCESREESGPYVAVDLSATGSEATTTGRARRAAERARAGEQPYPVMAQPVWTSASEPWVDLSLRVLAARRGFRGAPLPAGPGPEEIGAAAIRRRACAQGRSDRAGRSGWGRACGARTRRGRAGALLHLDVECDRDRGFSASAKQASLKTFALSRDGRRFAVLSAAGDLEIRDVSGPETAVFVAPKEEVVIHFVALGRSCLLIRETDDKSHAVRDRCLIRWDRGRLEVEREQCVFDVFAAGRDAGPIAKSVALGAKESPADRRGDLSRSSNTARCGF